MQGLAPRALRALLFATLNIAIIGAWAPARAAMPPSGLADEVAALVPSVVAIQTVATTPQGRMYFDGSGFIIEPSGIIATNRHVIAGAYQILVTIPGFKPMEAKPLYISEGIDLALLKVDAGRPLPAVKLGDSNTVRIGDAVMLIGNPLGVGESLSVGVVSALNRNIGETLYDHFIQTDAALNHGNSGGAMFNMAGEVIGIDTGLISSPNNTGSVGIGLAMPINDAKFVIDQFLRTGTVVRGWVGAHGQPVTKDLAEAFGMPSARGAILTGVEPNGPLASLARPGDIVLTVGGQDATDTRAAARLIAGTKPGDKLALTLLRNGEEIRGTVTVGKEVYDPRRAMAFLGHAPEGAKLAATPSQPGMTLAKIDETTRKRFGLEADQTGVVVTAVEPKGVAADRKIVAGDVILSVGGHEVNSPDTMTDALRDAVATHRFFAALLVAGARSTRWVALPLEADR